MKIKELTLVQVPAPYPRQRSGRVIFRPKENTTPRDLAINGIALVSGDHPPYGTTLVLKACGQNTLSVDALLAWSLAGDGGLEFAVPLLLGKHDTFELYATGEDDQLSKIVAVHLHGHAAIEGGEA